MVLIPFSKPIAFGLFGLFTMLAFSSISIVYAQNEYEFIHKWGSQGEDDGQFQRPHDVSFDSKGNVYVSDRDLNNIQVFTHEGEFIKKWGSEGSGNTELNVPYSIEVDSSDNVYVADRGNNRIIKFDSEGNYISQWGEGEDPGQFKRPEAIAIDHRNGDIYVADTGNDRIQKFDKNMKFILMWGSEGSGKAQFNHPHGVGVDSEGNVYVNELAEEPPSVPRVQKFDPNGSYILEWGSAGTGIDQFTQGLEHLGVSPDDRIFVVNGADDPEVKVFDKFGKFITDIGSGPCEIEEEVKTDPEAMSGPLPCDGKLSKPEHVAVDSGGKVFVVDRGNQRMVVYSPTQ